MTRVLANAVVDAAPSIPLHGEMLWRVTVTGHMWQGSALPVRTFEISAKSDTLAAKEGLDRFVKEFEADY